MPPWTAICARLRNPNGHLGRPAGAREGPAALPSAPGGHAEGRIASRDAFDPQEKFIPFTFRPETGPTIRTLALCRFLQIAAYNTEQISRRSQGRARSLRPPSWRRKLTAMIGIAAKPGSAPAWRMNYAATARAGGNAENLNVLRVGWSGSASKRRAVATDRPEPCSEILPASTAAVRPR